MTQGLKPSQAAILEARARIVAAFRLDAGLRHDAEDIADEAVMTAYQTFDDTKGAMFSAYAMACAQNAARAFLRAEQRAQGRTRRRARTPDDWAPYIERLEPKAFAQWFDSTAAVLEAEGMNVMDAIEYAVRSVISLIQGIAPEMWEPLPSDTPSDGGPRGRAVLWSIVLAATEGLGEATPTADAVIHSALGAVGIKGEGFDHWLSGLRQRRRMGRDTHKRHERVPDQVATLWAFLSTRCEVGAKARVAASVLRAAYEEFCSSRDQVPIPPTDFGTLMSQLEGVEKVRGAKGHDYKGLALTVAKNGGRRKV